MLKRDLDGFYLRVHRDGKWCNRCFTDLTEEEQRKWLERLHGEGLRSMVGAFCEHITKLSEVDLTDAELRIMVFDMAAALRKFGDMFGILNVKSDDKETVGGEP